MYCSEGLPWRLQRRLTCADFIHVPSYRKWSACFSRQNSVRRFLSCAILDPICVEETRAEITTARASVGGVCKIQCDDRRLGRTCLISLVMCSANEGSQSGSVPAPAVEKRVGMDMDVMHSQLQSSNVRRKGIYSPTSLMITTCIGVGGERDRFGTNRILIELSWGG